MGQADLIQQRLSAYGPATPKDVQRWTGLGATHVKAALRAVGAVEVGRGGTTGAVPARRPRADPRFRTPLERELVA